VIAIGLLGAVFAAEAVRTLLYDVRGLDPLTFIGAAETLGMAALLACFIPAVRPRECRRSWQWAADRHRTRTQAPWRAAA
jgi:hypothetical protein